MMSTPQHKRIPTPGENDLAIDYPERRASPDLNARTIAGIKAAVTSYYLDLDARKHGGVAQDHAFNKIEQMLGMSWSQHQADMAAAKEQK